MTQRERLHTEGFHFFCFPKREQREAFKTRDPGVFEFVEVDEKFCHAGFEVFFLGVRKLHHTPVKFTRPLEA